MDDILRVNNNQSLRNLKQMIWKYCDYWSIIKRKLIDVRLDIQKDPSRLSDWNFMEFLTQKNEWKRNLSKGIRRFTHIHPHQDLHQSSRTEEPEINSTIQQILENKRIFPNSNCLGCQFFLLEDNPIPGIDQVNDNTFMLTEREADNPKKLQQILVALLNSHGGYLYIVGGNQLFLDANKRVKMKGIHMDRNKKQEFVSKIEFSIHKCCPPENRNYQIHFLHTINSDRALSFQNPRNHEIGKYVIRINLKIKDHSKLTVFYLDYSQNKGKYRAPMDTYIFSKDLSQIYETSEESIDEEQDYHNVNPNIINQSVLQKVNSFIDQKFVFSPLKMSGMQVGNLVKMSKTLIYRYMVEKYHQRNEKPLWRDLNVCLEPVIFPKLETNILPQQKNKIPNIYRNYTFIAINPKKEQNFHKFLSHLKKKNFQFIPYYGLPKFQQKQIQKIWILNHEEKHQIVANQFRPFNDCKAYEIMRPYEVRNISGIKKNMKNIFMEVQNLFREYSDDADFNYLEHFEMSEDQSFIRIKRMDVHYLAEIIFRANILRPKFISDNWAPHTNWIVLQTQENQCC